MSYGLNVEMHKQTEICKRLDAIIRQVLPFLSGEVSPSSSSMATPNMLSPPPSFHCNALSSPQS